MQGHKSSAQALGVLTWAILGLLYGQSATALDAETASLGSNPPDLTLLQPGSAPTDGSVITADTISQSELTVPSLWWTQEQFGEKLLDNWLAYPGTDGTPRRVDLIVNQQVWSLYSYLERYAFVNRFGTTARTYGYSTRVFNRQQEFLAAYICAPGAVPSPADSDPFTATAGSPSRRTDEIQPDCTMHLNPRGSVGLRGGSSNPFAGSPPTGGGTAQP